MRHKLDWLYLQPALITVSAALVMTMLLVYFSYIYRSEVQADYDTELTLYRDIERKISEVNEDKMFIEVYGERFKALESAGIFVAEQRVSWVDSLQTAIREMKLPNVRYEVSPQRVSADNLSYDANNITVHASPLKIEMNLLHEQDMITLLERLEHNVVGRFLIDSCEIKRAEVKFGYYLDRPNLGITCHMRWLTLSPAANEANVGLF